MIRWGRKSETKIAQLCPELQSVLLDYADGAPRSMDLSIVVGHRGKAAQDAAFESGKSKVQWPNSKHNGAPSDAFDFLPCPFSADDWKDSLRFARIAGALIWVAAEQGITLRWGGDWDQDGKSNDQTFMDLMHIEVVR